MTGKTLTDELRSVLLFHSLEAPQPNATVDRILNDTVGSVVALGAAGPAAGDRPKRPRRVSVLQLVAASVIAVLLLAVAGINSVRNRHASQTASQAGREQVSLPASDTAAGGSFALPSAGRAKAAPASPPAYSGSGLNCSKLPGGGRLTTGQWDDYSLSTGETGYLYEFLCVGQNGQRSASELQVFKQSGGTLQYKQTLLPAAADQHVDFLTVGADTVRIQASVQSAVSGRARGEVISTAWDLSDADPGEGHSFTVAGPCLRKDLTATVTAAPDAAAPSWRLVLRNGAPTACALEGYPQVRAQLAGTPLSTAVLTLSGTVGGITKQPVPPIIVLSPGATASAIIEQSGASAAGSCQRADRLAVTLPNGVSLGLLPAELSGCGLAVHPLVGNVRGSD
ncbi:MAG: hypothetical protein QOE53_627 [Pseudonocardiales bacterium]|nr:hypothetical protein [Pseudonocardiales bacterium]